MSTSDEVLEILTMLATAYPRFKLEEQTVEIYYRLLKDIPSDQLRAAAIRSATGGDFFPSVHELRQEVTQLRLLALNIPNAYQAWSEILRAGRGEYKHVVEEDGQFYIEKTRVQFSHDLVRQVAEMLGWPEIFPGDDNLVADRAHFFKAYDAELSRILDADIQLPEIQDFIASSRHELLGDGNGRKSNQAESIGEVARRIPQLQRP